jgi:hypothetical protein
MGDWSRRPIGQKNSRALSVSDNFGGANLGSGSGVGNTKGTWVQVIAACPVEASGFILVINNDNLGNAEVLLDIGIGASGSEVVILPDLYLHPLQNDTMFERLYVPLAIPAGARVASRIQASTSTVGQLLGSIQPIAGGFMGVPGFKKCVSVGIDQANSRASAEFAIDYSPGYSALADVVPECRGFLLEVWPSALYTPTADLHLSDLAVGAGGGGAPSSLLAAMLPIRIDVNKGSVGCLSGYWPIRIPGGSKLWFRPNGGGYSGHNVRVALHGFQ